MTSWGHLPAGYGERCKSNEIVLWSNLLGGVAPYLLLWQMYTTKHWLFFWFIVLECLLFNFNQNGLLFSLGLKNRFNWLFSLLLSMLSVMWNLFIYIQLCMFCYLNTNFLNIVTEPRGLVCDSECKNGCWGAGNTQCHSCRHAEYGDHCVPDCSAELLFQQPGEKQCQDCHAQCKTSCTGPVSDVAIRSIIAA